MRISHIRLPKVLNYSALKKLDDQILLLDVAEGLPQGEAMDINHMLSEQGIDVEVKGSNDYFDIRVVVFGIPNCFSYI